MGLIKGHNDRTYIRSGDDTRNVGSLPAKKIAASEGGKTVTLELPAELAAQIISLGKILESQQADTGTEFVYIDNVDVEALQEYTETVDGDERDILDGIIEYVENTGEEITLQDAKTIARIFVERMQKITPVVPLNTPSKEEIDALREGRHNDLQPLIDKRQLADIEATLDTIFEELTLQISDETHVAHAAEVVASIAHGGATEYEFPFKVDDKTYLEQFKEFRVDAVIGNGATPSLQDLYQVLRHNELDNEAGTILIENAYRLDVITAFNNASGAGFPYHVHATPEALDEVITAENGTDEGRMRLLEAGIFPMGLNFSGSLVEHEFNQVCPPSASALEWIKLNSHLGSYAFQNAIRDLEPAPEAI
jgi:hypothetical protein